MLVSSVNRSPLMQRIPVERTGVQIPALAHPLPGALPCRLLLRCRHTPTADRHQPGNRLAVAGDDEFLARLDRADAAGEALVGFAEGEGLAHAALCSTVCGTYNSVGRSASNRRR